MVSFCKIQDHTREVNCCAFSTEVFVTCSGDKSLRIYKIGSFDEVAYSPLKIFKYGINNVTFNKTGELLATADTDGKSHIFKFTKTSYEIVAIFEHSSVNTVQVAAFSPDSKHLISGSSDGSIALWSIVNKHLIKEVSGHGDGYVYAADFTPSGDHLATGSALGDIRIWDMKGNKITCILQIEAHDEGDAGCGVSWLKFSSSYQTTVVGSNGISLLASCGQDGDIKLWLFNSEGNSSTTSISRARRTYHQPKPDKTLQKVSTLSGHTAPVSCCAFSSDGKLLATSSFDKTTIVWDPESGEEILKLEGHTAIVTSCAFSFDSRFLASTSYDKTAFIWKISDLNEKGADGKTVSVVEEDDTAVNVPAVTVESVKTESPLPPESKSLPCVVTTDEHQKWTSEQVSEWLRDTVQLGQYCQIFLDNEIDGAELSSLNQESLQKDLGIRPLGHRNKILRAAKELADDGNKLAKLSSSTFDINSLPSALQKLLGQINIESSSQSKIEQSDRTVMWQSTSNRADNQIRVTETRKSKQAVEKRMPPEFFCPISQEVMTDPVLAADGFTYERSSIESWLKMQRNSIICNSPMTNKPLINRTLVPNQALKAVIAQYNSGAVTNIGVGSVANEGSSNPIDLD